MSEAAEPESKTESTPYKDKNLSIMGRVAVYDNNLSIPRVIDVEFNTVDKFLSEMSQKTYSISHELGEKSLIQS
jgi:hypothetical protein